jgi:hypothetical protein
LCVVDCALLHTCALILLKRRLLVRSDCVDAWRVCEFESSGHCEFTRRRNSTQTSRHAVQSTPPSRSRAHAIAHQPSQPRTIGDLHTFDEVCSAFANSQLDSTLASSSSSSVPSVQSRPSSTNELEPLLHSPISSLYSHPLAAVMSHSHKDPGDRVLIEDAHQGVTSQHAQATIDRYRAFVRAKDAPIAHMTYSPFTKSDAAEPSNHPQSQSTHANACLHHAYSYDAYECCLHVSIRIHTDSVHSHVCSSSTPLVCVQNPSRF